MTGLIPISLDSILMGYQRWPEPGQWMLSILLMLIFGRIALMMGVRSRLIHKVELTLSIPQQALLGLRLLVHPAFIEETIFRGLLLPQPSNPITPSIAIWTLLSLASFVLAHPLNGLILNPGKRRLFTNPTFLFLAGLLGLFTSILYWISSSLWPPVLFHWLVVWLWFTRYGGLTKVALPA